MPSTHIQDIKTNINVWYGVDVFSYGAQAVRVGGTCPVVRRNNLCLIIWYAREHALEFDAVKMVTGARKCFMK